MSILPTRSQEKAYYYIPSKKDIIICNAATCTKCHDEVISVDPTTFTACKCSNVQIKGGLTEIFHTWTDPEFYKRQIIVIEDDSNIRGERKVTQVVSKLKFIGNRRKI